MVKSPHSNVGGLALILLACMAVPVALVSFGIGAVNLAEGDLSAHDTRALDRAETARQQAEEARRENQATLDQLRQRNQQISEHIAARHAEVGSQRARGEAAAQELRELGQQAETLRAEIREAERQAADLHRKIEEKQSVGVGRIYGGAGSGVQPQWVECRGGTVVLQPQGQPISLGELEQKSPAFVGAITETGYVVFLVRPDGFESFDGARALAEEHEVKIGYEPVDEEWKVRF